MRKRGKFGIVSASIVTLGLVGLANGHPHPSTLSYSPPNHRPLPAVEIHSPTTHATEAPVIKTQTAPSPKVMLTCDGTSVTTHCTADGITYTTYVLHPAVAQKSHTVTDTTYEKQQTDVCTLCNDDTYSPSCATGRGACSHHGGVQQWNAPEYSQVPVTTTKTVIDQPAQAAYVEKAIQT